MTTRPDGQMDTAAAFAVKTPRENKRTRSEPEHVQDLVTPAPPSNKKKAASNEEDALKKKDAKRKRKSELQRQRRAARSKDEKDADRPGEATTNACGKIAGGEGRRSGAEV